MLKIKDLKIISGLEGNATDGWYMYSNVSEYTVTIQVDIETDSELESIGINYFEILEHPAPTLTQQSYSIIPTIDGAIITASYLVDRSARLDDDPYSLPFASISQDEEYIIEITNQSEDARLYKPICTFAPSPYPSFFCIRIMVSTVEYTNNKVIKCLTGPYLYAELDILFDPASNLSIEDCKYKIYGIDSNIKLGPIIYSQKKSKGYYRIGAMIYNDDDTLHNYISANSCDFQDTSVSCIAFVSDEYEYFNRSQIYQLRRYCGIPLNTLLDTPIYFSNNNTISIIGNTNNLKNSTPLTSNTDALHVWGNAIANNITDATSRLTAAQATLTTLNDMFTIETVVTGTYTTKKANTLEDTGITFGDLEQGAIYAIYGSNTNGLVADLRIRAKNGSGTDIYFYEYCLNSSTTMNLAWPVFYCRANKGSVYGDYHLLVSRTATGSNTYTIYKILGPLL